MFINVFVLRLIILLSFILLTNLLIKINLQYTSASYYKFDYIDVPWYFMWFLFFALSLFQLFIIIFTKEMPTRAFIIICNFLLISPIVLYPLYSKINYDEFIPHLTILLLSIMIISIISNSFSRYLKILSFKTSPKKLNLLLGAITFIGMGYFTFKFKGSLSLEWASMYDRRFYARDVFASDSIFRYFNAFFGGVLIPISAIYGAVHNSKFLIGISISSALLSFAAYGGKGVLFSPILAIILGYYLKLISRYRLENLLLIMFITFLTLCYIEFTFRDVGILNWYAFRRMFHTVGENTYQYWEYFSTNAKYLMSDTKLGSLFGLPAPELTKARLLGEVFYGNDALNANANVFAASYGDFGFVGMVGTAVLMGVILSFLDKVYRKKNNAVIICYVFFVSLIWTQGAFYTSLLSNGIFLGCLLLLFTPKLQTKRL